MIKLHSQLIEITKQSSGFETRRNYVSLSNIFKPVDDLLNDYYNGYTADDKGLFKCRMGYYMEKGMKERLLQIPGVTNGKEVVVPYSNGLIKGHPDFNYLSNPGDCKSYLLDEHLPDERKIPRKIYWQMNGYMFYSNTYSAILICESRESGFIKTIEVRRNANICEQIDEKCRIIMEQLNKMVA